MVQVRAAVEELRRRETDTGLHRLVVDDRVHDAVSRSAACDAIVRDWATDRARGDTARDPRRVCLITEDHRTRRALIARARDHLRAIGQLSGPALPAGGQEFQAGDEVIARAPARDLHPPGSPDRHVRNGTCGQVLAVYTPSTSGEGAGLWVDFDHRGVIFVPVGALERELRPGVSGVLTHSYALTSHAAQGTTYDVARMIASPSTSPAALYVGMSRARDDLRLYTAPSREHPSADPSAAAVIRDSDSGLAGLARAVRHRGDECLAVDRDPTLTDRLDPATGTIPTSPPSPGLDPAPASDPIALGVA
jgi:ATP-dependent exoDNAse (exonuclease V) alpha subunit